MQSRERKGMSTRQATTTDSLTSEDVRDLELIRVLKPYLAKALTLNHDVNNPLCAILGYAEFILSEEELSPDLRANVEQIMNAGERIRKLVDEMCAEKIAAAEKIDLSTVITGHHPVT